MSKIVTYADVLSDFQHKWLHDRFRNPEMRWYYLDNVSTHDRQDRLEHHKPSLAITIFDRDNQFIDRELFFECKSLLDTIIFDLELSHLEMVRVRLGMYLPIGTVNTHNPIHRDRTTEHTTVLYYLDNNDGDTLWFDEDDNVVHRQSPKSNHAVVFDGLIRHASTNPSSGTRMTLNINLE